MRDCTGSKSTAIGTIGAENCCGCFGCDNACPHKAIEFQAEGEGFYVPSINGTKCVLCGLCREACPVISIRCSRGLLENPSVYAAWSLNEQVRLASSSGGIFTELAKRTIEKGGIVFGAAWDENNTVEHIGVDRPDDLWKLRGSKYIQSRMGKSIAAAKKEVEGGRPVLFSGTPCQIAALRKTNENDGLILIDLICDGVPSLNIFNKYLSMRSKKRAITGINFRDKRQGWTLPMINIKFFDGTEYSRMFGRDYFGYGYNRHFFLNSICYRCPFSKIPRSGDISLGDYWEAPPYPGKEKGVSVVIVSTEKGQSFLSEATNIKLIPIEMPAAIRKNPRISDGRLKNPADYILVRTKTRSFRYVIFRYLLKDRIQRLPTSISNKMLSIVQKIMVRIIPKHDIR